MCIRDRYQTPPGGESMIFFIKKSGQFFNCGRGIRSQHFKTDDAKLLKIFRRRPLQKLNSKFVAQINHPQTDRVIPGFHQLEQHRQDFFDRHGANGGLRFRQALSFVQRRVVVLLQPTAQWSALIAWFAWKQQQQGDAAQSQDQSDEDTYAFGLHLILISNTFVTLPHPVCKLYLEKF